MVDLERVWVAIGGNEQGRIVLVREMSEWVMAMHGIGGMVMV